MRTTDSHVQGTCLYKSRNAQESLKYVFSIHTCFLSEEIEFWKKQSQMKGINVSRTHELSVAHRDIKRKEGTCNNESTTSVVCVFNEFNLVLFHLFIIPCSGIKKTALFQRRGIS